MVNAGLSKSVQIVVSFNLNSKGLWCLCHRNTVFSRRSHIWLVSSYLHTIHSVWQEGVHCEMGIPCSPSHFSWRRLDTSHMSYRLLSLVQHIHMEIFWVFVISFYLMILDFSSLRDKSNWRLNGYFNSQYNFIFLRNFWY